MRNAVLSSAFKRGRPLAPLVGLLSFAAAFGALVFIVTGPAASAVTGAAATTIMAACALTAAAIAHVAQGFFDAWVARRLVATNAHMRTALDSMTQGLSMFDASERLVSLSVADEGEGFPDDFAERAFDRFARADDSRSSGGTGLGLAIVAGVAELHRGRVTISGAEVRLEFPRAGGG